MASVQTLLLSSTRNVVTRSVLGPPEYSFEFMRIFLSQSVHYHRLHVSKQHISLLIDNHLKRLAYKSVSETSLVREEQNSLATRTTL